MRTSTFVCAVSVACVGFAGPSLSAGSQTVQVAPATTITETPNYVLPETLEAMSARVDAIVTASCERVIMRRDGVGSIVAECMARVVDVIKSGVQPLAVGDATPVRVVGGRAVGRELTPAEDVSGLQRSGPVVLFLDWNEDERAFYLAGGLNGAYAVSTGAVEPLGTAPLATAHRGRAASQFVTTVKRVVR